MEEPGLSSGGQFHCQSDVVLPGNAEISGQTHDTDGAISLTLFAGRLVLCRIPRIGGSKRFDSAGNTVKVTFSRCDHAILPIFGDDGNPCSRNIERGSHFRWLWSWCAALASLRVSIDRENQTKNHYQERALPPNNFVFHATTRALHKKSWAVIDRPYSLGCATVGALYERPRCIFCAKPAGSKKAAKRYTEAIRAVGPTLNKWRTAWKVC